MLKGDANLDGIVSEKDVTELRSVIKKIIFPSNYNFEAFDLDSNTILNSKDVTELQHILGKYIPGDADGDGELSDNDAAMIQKEIAGLVHLKGRNLKNADYNRDGKVNMRDVVALQRLLEKIKNDSMLKGDVNQDGIVNQKDVTELNRIFHGIIAPTPEQRYAGDLDNNGVLNAKDVLALRRILNRYVRGDADGDGKLSDNDVKTMQKEIADLLHLKDRNFENADWNSDGKINLKDVTNLQRHLDKISFEMQSESVKRLLDEINKNMIYETAGSSLKAVPMAVKLLDWGVATELTKKETKAVVSDWMAAKGVEKSEDFLQQMKLLDATYKQLLTKEAIHLLSDAGCENAPYPWSDGPVKPIEAMMEAVGLR